MSVFKTACPHCETEYPVIKSMIGRETHCNNCGNKFIIRLFATEEYLFTEDSEEKDSAPPLTSSIRVESRFPILRGIAFMQYVFFGIALLVGVGMFFAMAAEGNAGPGLSVLGMFFLAGLSFLLTGELIYVALAIEENTRKT